MLQTVLLIVLILLLIGGLPTWPHQAYGLGYWPSGGAGLLLIVLVIVLLLGR